MRIFDRIIVGAILGNVALVVGGLVVSEDYEPWFELAHRMILGLFLVELADRLREKGWRFLRSPWGLFDATLIAASVLPALGLDASMLRLARAARLLHLARHLTHLAPQLLPLAQLVRVVARQRWCRL